MDRQPHPGLPHLDGWPTPLGLTLPVPPAPRHPLLSAGGFVSSHISEEVKWSAELLQVPSAVPTCPICAQVCCLSLLLIPPVTLMSFLPGDKGHPCMSALDPSPCPPKDLAERTLLLSCHQPLLPSQQNPQSAEFALFHPCFSHPHSTAAALARLAVRPPQATHTQGP